MLIPTTVFNFKSTVFIVLLGFILINACEKKEYKKLDLKTLDHRLKVRGAIILEDILTSLKHKDGARFLLTRAYVTPMVHGSIMKNPDLYNASYVMAKMSIGKITGDSLFQVLDKGIIKTMRYKLKTDSKNMSFVELKIDINNNYNLADYYLYLTSKDGSFDEENILPIMRD